MSECKKRAYQYIYIVKIRIIKKVNLDMRKGEEKSISATSKEGPRKF